MRGLSFTILFIFTISTNAQKIAGLYKVDDVNLIVADIGQSYSFEKDGTFKNIIHEHLGQKTISGGNYELKGDTLELNYTRIKATPPDRINILQKERLKLSDTSFHPAFSNFLVMNLHI